MTKMPRRMATVVSAAKEVLVSMLRAIVALSFTLTLAACVVAPAPYAAPPPRVGYQAPPPGYPGPAVMVDVAPPPAYAEAVPVAPYVGAVWIGGYWNWYGGRYAWVPGRWAHARPGYRWAPHRWAAEGGHWHLQGGEWVRR
jgi:hypothetical protein